jgi:hypothetical protein
LLSSVEAVIVVMVVAGRPALSLLSLVAAEPVEAELVEAEPVEAEFVEAVVVAG